MERTAPRVMLRGERQINAFEQRAQLTLTGPYFVATLQQQDGQQAAQGGDEILPLPPQVGTGDAARVVCVS